MGRAEKAGASTSAGRNQEGAEHRESAASGALSGSHLRLKQNGWLSEYEDVWRRARRSGSGVWEPGRRRSRLNRVRVSENLG